MSIEFTEIPFNGMYGSRRVISEKPVDSLASALAELIKTGRQFSTNGYTFKHGFVEGTIEFSNNSGTEIVQQSLDKILATFIRCYGGGSVLIGQEIVAPQRDGGARRINYIVSRGKDDDNDKSSNS